MAILYVAYAGDANTCFDRKYYVETHLSLVRESWRKYGLQSVAAFFPEGSGEGIIAICACTFRNEAAIHASFAAPETREVMADIVHFTDAKPDRFLGTAL